MLIGHLPLPRVFAAIVCATSFKHLTRTVVVPTSEPSTQRTTTIAVSALRRPSSATVDLHWLRLVVLVLVVVDRIDVSGGRAAGRRLGACRLAFLINATRVQQVTEVADAGEVMPQKSTFFYPKLATGLVFNSLDD